MSNDAVSFFPIISSLISAIFGGLTVTIVSYLLYKPKLEDERIRTRAETKKFLAETDKFRSETKNKQKETDDTLDHHQDQLNLTVSVVRKILAYMPGYFAHLVLCQIRDKLDEYYNDSNTHQKRLLHLLLDNGY